MRFTGRNQRSHHFYRKLVSELVFSSAVFLFLFLPITIAGYYLLGRRLKNGFLLLASLLFYAWGEPYFVLIMILSILMNYVFGLLVVRREEEAYRKRILTLMVVSNLSLFFVFKYLNFTIENLNILLGDVIPQTHIRLPIGISFFTFQAMSYVFDVSMGRGDVQKNPLNVALYVSLFPQLIAGPIVRYETVAHEIQNRRETADDIVKGIRRFTVGLAKKMILSNSIGLLADQAFGCRDFSQLSILMAWVGVLAYAFQIYFDFGGYSDMAIGLGLMFGFHFEENFNYPYISRTVSEFWNRWHISLSSWFRDYLFYPVSRKAVPFGKKVKQKWGKAAGRLAPSIVALSVVWLSTGLWHGASWGYILWGVYYGVLLISALIFQPTSKKWVKQLGINTKSPWFVAFQMLRTMILVLLGYVFFRSATLGNAMGYYGSLFGLNGNPGVDAVALEALKNHGSALVLCAIGSVPFVPYVQKKLGRFGASEGLKNAVCLVLLVLSAAYIVSSTYNPFIYFAF